MTVTSSAFSESEWRLCYPEGFEQHFWHISRNRLILNYLNRWRAEPLLEIGAGRGPVLAVLRGAGWNAYGVELADMPPLSPELPIRYNQDAFLLPEEERATYRSVGLFDVLEHLPERVKFLTNLRQLFPSMQYLYLAVPARPEIWSNYDEFYRHYLRYTPEKLNEELSEAGYRIVFCRYIFHSLYWIIYLHLRIAKKREVKISSLRTLSIYLHKILGELFYWEGRLVPPCWYGSSLIAVAEPEST